MRAAQMKERPGFSLMKQTDVQTIYHMQMPRWLFSDPRYAGMSLDAKVTYTFLLNRFQLSRRNGWVNDFGEVFVIFPRKELARELRICEQRVTAAFKKLVELKLVWEKRCGRGDANQIYLASVEPVDNPSYSSAPFVPEPDSDSRTADSDGLDGAGFPMPEQEPQDLSGKNLQNGASRTAEPAVAEPQKMRPSYIRAYFVTSNNLEDKQYGLKYGRIGARELGKSKEKACTYRGRSGCIRTTASCGSRTSCFRMENWTQKTIGSNWRRWSPGKWRRNGMQPAS